MKRLISWIGLALILAFSLFLYLAFSLEFYSGENLLFLWVFLLGIFLPIMWVTGICVFRIMRPNDMKKA